MLTDYSSTRCPESCAACEHDGKCSVSVEAEVAAQAWQEPFARTTGYYGGRAVIEPIKRAMVIPVNLALYAAPVACPKCASEYSRGKEETLDRVRHFRRVRDERDALQAKVAEQSAEIERQTARAMATQDEIERLERRDRCHSKYATRPILYTDGVNGEQCCRDDLWAISTAELNEQAALLEKCEEALIYSSDRVFCESNSDPIGAALAAIKSTTRAETPFDIGRRLRSEGKGISDIWGAVACDKDMDEAMRGYSAGAKA